MSDSPPKDVDVEQGPPSSDGQEGPMDPESEAQGQGGAYEFDVKEQDRWLPIANVARIMKTALPDNAKIAKEAKECMQECVSEFISFITSEASEKCHQEKRKTVNGEDILFAMTSLGFENYSEALKIYLSKYRETQSSRGDQQSQAGPSGGYSGGPVGGQGDGQGVPSQADFQGQSNAANNILSPQGLTNHDPNSYGGSYPQVIPGAHNGAGGDGY